MSNLPNDMKVFGPVNTPPVDWKSDPRVTGNITDPVQPVKMAIQHYHQAAIDKISHQPGYFEFKQRNSSAYECLESISSIIANKSITHAAAIKLIREHIGQFDL